MKKLLFLLCTCVSLSLSKTADAQWVTIPDPNFQSYLNLHFPGAMVGNQLDTSNSLIINCTTVNCWNMLISDLTGIQYFDHLSTLDCHNNSLTSLPQLPPMLIALRCYQNHLTTFSNLPNLLSILDCHNNQITTFPIVPNSVTFLDCSSNQISTLNNLPNSLQYFDCGVNQITALPNLPTSITTLRCYNNLLTSLPTLPNSLQDLTCDFNQFNTLPTLPNSLTNLYCLHDQLTSLPALPNSLLSLWCDQNQLTTLPALPNSITILSCYDNLLTSLPVLPQSLTDLYCNLNQLTSIPTLPDSMYNFDCSNNPNLNCLPQLKYIEIINFTNTGINCIPNYPIGADTFSSFPNPYTFQLCNYYNNNGCPVYWNIAGNVYVDSSLDCIHQLNEINLHPVKVNLFQSGSLIEQQILTNGIYSFDTYLNTYHVELDTTNLPFLLNCFSNGINDTIINVTAIDSMHYNVDFGMHCKPGFDIGVNSAVRDSGRFIPGRFCLTTIYSGDMSNFYGTHCAAGVGGSVVATLSGPVTYAGYKAGSLAPTTVNGNTVTWNIADFGSVNFNSDFHLRFHTDTSATIGQQVCFTVSVTPTAGDNDTTNNFWSGCFNVQTSFDPNEKEVSPIGNIDSTQKWLTYTIHFQNTGTATAQHIYVDDTLDTDLDESSFQLLSYSVAPFVQIKGNAVRFNFPNINLPDSNANEPGSHGYVQYRIKPKHNLAVGTNINNTAFIYFDFNPPVLTNTTMNTVVLPNEVDQFQVSGFKFQLFPNPAKDELNILFSQQGNYEVKIVDVMGKEILSATSSLQHPTFNIQHLSSGIYFVEVRSENYFAVKKFVHQ